MSPPRLPPPTKPIQKPANTPYLFPRAQSTILPNLSAFFSPNLLSNPLPTNSFQNFILKNGDQPEYLRPYLVKSSSSSLSLCYPSRFSNSSFLYQIFNADLTILAPGETSRASQKSHVISSFNDLSVTLDIPSSNRRFFLVRGSPFLTRFVSSNAAVSISTPWFFLVLLSLALSAAYSYSLLSLKPLSLSSPPPLETNPKATPSNLLSLLGPNRRSFAINPLVASTFSPASNFSSRLLPIGAERSVKAGFLEGAAP